MAAAASTRLHELSYARGANVSGNRTAVVRLSFKRLIHRVMRCQKSCRIPASNAVDFWPPK
jgi:hypothetical protein